jgi:hypothetical protein
MVGKNLVLLLVLLLFSFTTFSQSTYLSLDSKHQIFIERMELKAQTDSTLNFSSIQPYNRKFLTEAFSKIEDEKVVHIDKVDQYNLRSFLMANKEWSSKASAQMLSKRNPLKKFYASPVNFFETNQSDFFLAVNPVLYFQYGQEKDYDKKLVINSRGVSVRGLIGGKVGFATQVTDNQERGPLFFQEKIQNNGWRALPGVGFFKDFKEDVSINDYFDARGYFTFNATGHIDVQFGFDKNFIGNGYRSLFLSDWGNSYLFAKLNTRIWKFNYQNLYMELMPQFKKEGDTLLDRKYAAMHHLSINVTPKLNIGFFEGIIFSRKNHFDYAYLNPIIFYRHIEGNAGSPDNALAGLDFKWNPLRRTQLYGQFLLDEFILSKIKNNTGNWTNKFAIQLGAKYVDAFGVKHLDLQVEANRVRPFTYSHSDSVSNYTHYNQPLAHPLGANFEEFLAIANYQPYPRLNLNTKFFYYKKGLDSSGLNFGGNIFRTYNSRNGDDGFFLANGNKVTCTNIIFNLSYEMKQNLFFDLGFTSRRFFNTKANTTTSSTIFQAAMRLNIGRREYDF